jgi:hypothetical protein
VKYVEIGCGAGHTTARRSDGSVVAWGRNLDSELSVPSAPSGWMFARARAGGLRSVAILEPLPACGSASLSCWPGSANSASPSGAHILVEGCAGMTANDLVFTVTGLPQGVPGIFLYGPQQMHAPLGNGWACVGGSVQRVLPALHTNPAGNVVFPVDLTSFPFSGSANTITAGSGWNFQYWYRDSAGNPSTFNFSDAQHIVFAP